MTEKIPINYQINGWEDENLNLKTNLIRGIYSNGFEKPSSIQQKHFIHSLIPPTKRDIIAQAQSELVKQGIHCWNFTNY